ncbi:hypothetical protein [Actinomycetospora sp. CA-053990]|uniref:hypothetical protein n=1 Tax=Actinomycetospora sp. CA-053990 TaxID=3239891 RepID=UPI003D8C82AF
MTPLAVWWTVLPLAAPPPGAPPGSERGEEFGKTSPIALVVILLLGLATALLIRSMNKQLRKVPPSFDPEPPESREGDDGPADPDDPVAPTAPRTDRTADPPGTGSS